MTAVVSLPIASWDSPCSMAERERALRALERGGVLLFPLLQFSMQESEERLLSARMAGDGKNISFNPANGELRGVNAEAAQRQALRAMMQRFAAFSKIFLQNLLPRYEPGLQQARTSYRPIEIAGRPTSWRKDDTRLHVDNFPSSPTQGKR